MRSSQTTIAAALLLSTFVLSGRRASVLLGRSEPLLALPAASEQPRGAPPTTAPGGQPPPAGQRGGRGRGAVQVMVLSTTAWPDGGQIPPKHTQAGEEA